MGVVPTTTAPTAGLVRAELSAAQLRNVQQPSIWLDDEAQAELGELVVVGATLWGTPAAFAFMADNAEDMLTDTDDTDAMLRGSRRDSIVAIAKRLDAAAEGRPYVQRRSR